MLLGAACNGEQLDAQVATLGLNADGLHLDVTTAPGVSIDVGGKAVALPTGKGRVVVPVSALPVGQASVSLPFSRTRMLIITDRGTINATVPFDSKVAANLPKPDAAPWIQWVKAQGGTASRPGTLLDGDRKILVRLDDEGDAQLTFASSKGLVLELGDGPVASHPELGGGRVQLARLLGNATFDYLKNDGGEWLVLDVPVKGSKPSRLLLDRGSAEEHVSKRINRMVAQKTAFGPKTPDAKRVLVREANGGVRFLGPSSPIQLIALGQVKAQREAPECTKFTIDAKVADTEAKPPKSIPHLLVDVELTIYDRSGRELGKSEFPGGSLGCPTTVSPRQARETFRDGPAPAQIDAWIQKFIATADGTPAPTAKP